MFLRYISTNTKGEEDSQLEDASILCLVGLSACGARFWNVLQVRKPVVNTDRRCTMTSVREFFYSQLSGCLETPRLCGVLRQKIVFIQIWRERFSSWCQLCQMEKSTQRCRLHGFMTLKQKHWYSRGLLDRKSISEPSDFITRPFSHTDKLLWRGRGEKYEGLFLRA